MASNSEFVKFCLVTGCKNNSKVSANKYFFMLPFDPSRRNAWLTSLNGCDRAEKVRAYVCEDHVNLKEDAENFLQVKLMNDKPRLKKNVVPSISVSRHGDNGVEQKRDLPAEVNKDYLEQPVPVKCGRGSKSKDVHSQNLSSSTHSASSIDTGSATYKDSDYEPDSSDSTCGDDIHNFRQQIIIMIETNPKIFLGLPLESYFLIKMLSNSVSTSTINILITLKKIRLDYAFKLLGIHFGMTDSNVGKIFRKTVIQLAQVLQELIVWPDSKKIKLNLPISFRARYGKVVSIIDCLEIEIEKPSNPVHQSLTWSQYKHCNTIKYLLSCTPDGLVSFISNGFGGRATDVDIVENCGYLEKLTPGMEIMAERGFKNLSPLLTARRCALIRPPSVSSSTPSSPAEVKESKRIAALRIHVERVIGRLRDFKMLEPHSCIDHNLIQLLDYIIVIACGIINFQDPLFRD